MEHHDAKYACYIGHFGTYLSKGLCICRFEQGASAAKCDRDHDTLAFILRSMAPTLSVDLSLPSLPILEP